MTPNSWSSRPAPRPPWFPALRPHGRESDGFSTIACNPGLPFPWLTAGFGPLAPTHLHFSLSYFPFSLPKNLLSFLPLFKTNANARLFIPTPAPSPPCFAAAFTGTPSAPRIPVHTAVPQPLSRRPPSDIPVVRPSCLLLVLIFLRFSVWLHHTQT